MNSGYAWITDKMSEENRAHVRAWVTALRSGEYPQGRKALMTKEGYCCLGVACDIFSKETGQGEWVPVNSSEFTEEVRDFSKFEVGQVGGPPVVSSYYTEAMVLPGVVAEWLFGSATERNPGGVFDGHQAGLAIANDEGKSFEEIANAIEETYL